MGNLVSERCTGGYIDLGQYFIARPHKILHGMRLTIKSPRDHPI